MLKRIAAVALATGLMVTVTSLNSTAYANNGRANGHGCVSTTHGGFNNPGAFLQTMADRDGSIQNTVAEWNFGSVANLIDVKCGS